MAKLQINTRLNSVVICGAFCDWNIDDAIRLDRPKGARYIIHDNMPKGEYKVFSCKSFLGSEVYPTDGRGMSNRYFNGLTNETINVYFEKEATNE